MREREILNKSLVKAEEKTRRMYDLIKINENKKKNLENEINGFKVEALKQRQHIEQLEEEVKRYEREGTVAHQKYYTALEEMRLQETQIVELQKKISEGEGKLRQQQNLYEAVRTDRNMYSKNLIQSQEQIFEMKRRFKLMNHQIEQLKEEITSKDHSLVKEHFDHHKVEKEKEKLKHDLTAYKKKIEGCSKDVSKYDADVKELIKIIQHADEEKVRQTKQYKSVISERDILGSQLVKRNEELSALYEKIKIQKSSISKAEAEYFSRRDQIKSMQRELQKSAVNLEQSRGKVEDVKDLRRQIFTLERDLIREKMKVNALNEELERPLNVHRWRKLEGSDPHRFTLIKKIQNLQKRLIDKTEEVLRADTSIQEKEKLYVELKNILARQPGPEVAEQLSLYQKNLKDKGRKMQAMKTELQLYKSQVNEYKFDIERLNGEMKEMKQAYFSRMREKRSENPEEDDVVEATEGKTEGALMAPELSIN